MATFTLVEGTNNMVSPRADGLNTEAGLAQSIVNGCISLGKKNLTVVWVYDDVARTLTATFSGTAG
jgi:hypothetical protein